MIRQELIITLGVSIAVFIAAVGGLSASYLIARLL